MKRINKNLVRAVVIGIALTVPYGVQAAEYDAPILGSGDNFDAGIKTGVNNDYTYKFAEDSTLKLVDIGSNSPIYSGIGLGITDDNKNDNSITIKSEHKLNISIENSKHFNSGYKGIAITANGAKGKTIDRSSDGDITITVKDSVVNNALVVDGASIEINESSNGENNTIKLGDSNIKIDAENIRYGATATGIRLGGSSNNIITMGNGTIDVTARSTAKSSPSKFYVGADGVFAYNSNSVTIGKVDIKSKAIGTEYVAETLAQGLVATDGAKVTAGIGDITAIAKNSGDGTTLANGIYSWDGSVTKGDGSISASAKGSGTLAARGVFLDGSGRAELGVVDISAKTEGGNVEGDCFVDAIGVWTKNTSEFTMAGGSISASAVDENGAEKEGAGIYSILSAGGSKVKINQDSENKVNINGKVKSSGTSKIYLTMNTSDSNLNGLVNDDSQGITMKLANGAAWNNNGASNVTHLTMNGGVINQDNDAAHTIEVDNYSGTGNIVFHSDGVDDDGTLNITSGGIEINNAAEKSVINIGVIGDKIDSFELSKAKESLERMANQITFTGTDENLSGTVKIDEGLISSEASAELYFNDIDNIGHINLDSIEIGAKETATMRTMRDIASTAIVAWRQEDSTLSQRLGELRNSDGDQGIWTRMSRGEFEYDGAYKNQYNFFQLGYDKAYGDWHYGAAISHNDGKTTYAEGSGENRSTSLSLYGTWLGDKGHYADIVLKQGRLSNEFDTYAAAGHTHGDYDAWGTSLSGEYGRKTELNDGWYVTPQAQLTLMRIGGESYTTDNGISVDQETLNSAVGRVGFEIGKTVNDKGAVYAKVSVLHEFAGNADTYLSLNGIHNSYSQDIGGTWYEAGIGVSYKTSSDSYIYADVVKTFGGDVETPWQWNAGVRYSF